jgi:hypothetical protein
MNKAPLITETGEESAVPATIGSRIQGLCEGNNALQLWFLILAIYVVIAALTALAKPPLAEKSPIIPLALILTPLVLILGFWYFAPACRAAGWVPAVSVIIAIAGLLVAFREEEGMPPIITLPAAKPNGAPNKPQPISIGQKPQAPQTPFGQPPRPPQQKGK